MQVSARGHDGRTAWPVLAPVTKEESSSLSSYESSSLGVNSDLVSPMSISSQSSSGDSNVASPTATSAGATSSPASNSPAKVKLRNKDRSKASYVRPNSIAFSSYPTFEFDPGLQTTPEKTSRDDSSEAYMARSSKKLRPNGDGVSSEPTSERKYRWGRYSEREVYRQITRAMEHHLQSQAYEASKKARSLDDILTSGLEDASSSSSSSACQYCAVLSRLSRRCGSTVAVDQLSPCRCGGVTAEPYQSNSSISSGGSHSSLHGSMEIIQVS